MLVYKTLNELDLHQGFEKKEFALAFQPIMNLKSDSFETFEAFIRWHHPTLGTLPPSVFMCTIEECNLQEQMTEYILNAAAEQIINNYKSGYGETGINVNLTPKEFYNPNTLIQLEKVVKKLPYPEFLGLEISPKILTSYIDNNSEDTEYYPDIAPSEMEVEFLKNIRIISEQYINLGVTLALDTTDYIIGSLIRADLIGFHAIKINIKSLQSELISDINILSKYAKASKDFQIPLIIVGIENQLLFTAAYNNIEYAQGFFICPPLCLDNPQKFYSYLDTYFSIKKSITELKNSINTLNTTKLDLLSLQNTNNIMSDDEQNIPYVELKSNFKETTYEIEKQSCSSEIFENPKIDSFDMQHDTQINDYTENENFQDITPVIENINQEILPENPVIKRNFGFSGNNSANHTFGNRQIFGKK